MIKLLKTLGLGCMALSLMTGCIKEVTPQSNVVSEDQIADSQTSFPGMVKACLTPLITTHMVMSKWPWDFAYPSLMLERDCLGQDYVNANNFWSIWYSVGTALGSEYLGCQLPWSFYYKVIHNSNTVIGMIPDPAAATPEQRSGAGIAYAMRAFSYMDLARMFQYTYVGNQDKPTVPIVRENMSLDQIRNNPRASNEVIWRFILEDLDRAEAFLTGYQRADKTEPDVSVVYGLKARAYLTIEDFPNAEKYAKLAQNGYAVLTEAQWLDKTTGFNTLSSGSWLWGMQQTADDPIIKNGGGLYSWISSFSCEQDFGYGGSEGGYFNMIDAHLYSTIPATDFRKKAFLAPADAGSSNMEVYKKYTNYVTTDKSSFKLNKYPALTSFKFRPNNGGYTDYLVGCAVGIPLMRVEEMLLIEAEAVGMQTGREAEGRTLLENFAKTRDAAYTYKTMLSLRDNVWWQRRVELWGEGFATFDLKRMNKGIIRSYKGTNHMSPFRFNTTTVPMWTNFVIIGTEFDYNKGITENNPTPVAPSGDSPEHDF